MEKYVFKYVKYDVTMLIQEQKNKERVLFSRSASLLCVGVLQLWVCVGQVAYESSRYRI